MEKAKVVVVGLRRCLRGKVVLKFLVGSCRSWVGLHECEERIGKREMRLRNG